MLCATRPSRSKSETGRSMATSSNCQALYAETKALPSGTAVEVAKFFVESIVLRHGAPQVLITDRGSSFMAQLTQEILRLSHTDHRRTTAYHPQTNGRTERLNKTISDMISMYVDVEHMTWDEVLPYVTFAYNTAIQETTGVTPFQLVHGRKVTTMLDAMLPHDPTDDGTDDAQLVTQRAEVRQLARLRIKDQQRVDAGRTLAVEFQPGVRVWVWTPIRRRGLSEKLLKRYFGPYKVIRRLGDLNYEVLPDGTRPSGRRQPRPEVVHVVRLKPFYAR
ncbi:DDE-type integrase/transposase/recombinase [Ixodes scapularis]